MNRGKEIIDEAKAMREARESLDEVRKPWYLAKAPSFPIIYAVCVLGAFVFPLLHLPTSKWWLVAWIILLGILFFLNQRYRDRAWRRLIELEAPELHRKISAKPEA